MQLVKLTDVDTNPLSETYFQSPEADNINNSGY